VIKQVHQILNTRSNDQVISINQRRKKDALELAKLVYDMYKEEKRSKIINGQNNAHSTSSN